MGAVIRKGGGAVSRFGFCADVHLGNHKKHGGPVVCGLNRRCLDGLRVFEAAVNRAIAQQCEVLVVLGDLLDYDRPEAQLIAEIQRILEVARAAGLPVLLIEGNHEQVSTTSGDHALGPFSPMATIVEKPMIVRAKHAALLAIPFRPMRAKKWLEEALSALPIDDITGPVGFAVHMGLIAADTPPWLRTAEDAIGVEDLAAIAKSCGSFNVFAGNWHNRRLYKREGVTMLQLGALVPTGWDNPGSDGYGTLAFWDVGPGGSTVRYEELPGPRFLSAPEGLEAVVEAYKRGELPHVGQLYLNVPSAPESLVQSAGELDGYIQAGVISGGEAVPDAAMLQAASAAAATAAKEATTLGEALSGYVAEMTLEDAADRASVLARSRRYLGL